MLKVYYLMAGEFFLPAILTRKRDKEHQKQGKNYDIVLKNRKLTKLIIGIMLLVLCNTLFPVLKVQAMHHEEQWYLEAINALEARKMTKNSSLQGSGYV